MVQSPCLNCQNKFLGCHSTCQTYLEFKEKINIEKELIRKQKESKNLYFGYKQAQREEYKRCHR